MFLLGRYKNFYMSTNRPNYIFLLFIEAVAIFYDVYWDCTTVLSSSLNKPTSVIFKL